MPVAPVGSPVQFFPGPYFDSGMTGDSGPWEPFAALVTKALGPGDFPPMPRGIAGGVWGEPHYVNVVVFDGNGRPRDVHAVPHASKARGLEKRWDWPELAERS